VRIVANIFRPAPLLVRGIPNFSLIPVFRSLAKTTTSESNLADNCVNFCAAQKSDAISGYSRFGCGPAKRVGGLPLDYASSARIVHEVVTHCPRFLQ
jgi:hypothetical protein